MGAVGTENRHFNTCFHPRPKFWENLTSPLFGTLSPPSETSEVSYVEGRAEARVPEQKGWSVASRKGPSLKSHAEGFTSSPSPEQFLLPVLGGGGGGRET
jgi:hypothetical protein